MKFEFWLELQKADDLMLVAQIAALKKHHEFIGVIRDGIRLICDLRAGRTDVLLDLFPTIVQRLQADAGIQFEGIIRREVERAMSAQPAMGQGRAVEPQLAPAPRVPAAAVGVEVVAAKGNADISGNFMKSMQSLASGFFD